MPRNAAAGANVIVPDPLSRPPRRYSKDRLRHRHDRQRIGVRIGVIGDDIDDDPRVRRVSQSHRPPRSGGVGDRHGYCRRAVSALTVGNRERERVQSLEPGVRRIGHRPVDVHHHRTIDRRVRGHGGARVTIRISRTRQHRDHHRRRGSRGHRLITATGGWFSATVARGGVVARQQIEVGTDDRCDVGDGSGTRRDHRRDVDDRGGTDSKAPEVAADAAASNAHSA